LPTNSRMNDTVLSGKNGCLGAVEWRLIFTLGCAGIWSHTSRRRCLREKHG
jgi:hypothetical protein